MTTLSVLDAALEAPRRVAVADGRSELAFAELAERVRERMRALAPLVQLVAHATSLVAVQTDERLATIETLLALIELGIPFLPLHQRWSESEREALLAALPVSCVVELDRTDALELVPRPFAPSAHATTLLSTAPHLAALATSGSTGRPRVALLPRAAFVAAARASASHLGWHESDRWLLCLPLAHVGGLSVVTRCLLARQTIALMPPPPPGGSSERLAQAIRVTAPTLISMVPAQIDGLLELGTSFDLPATVRAILTGGAAASARLLGATAERGWPVLTSYGLTEACSQVATQRPGTVNRGERGVGVPLPGIGVRIEGGVIQIDGPTLASGYLGAGEEEIISEKRGFRTRDLGRFDSAGQLHVLGRVDDLIISGGENVAPWEVETLLQGCEGVLEACVFGADDARWGQIVVAGIRTRVADVDGLIAAVERVARERLASFKRPRFYVCEPEFVQNRNGKLDRAATIELLRARLLESPGRHRRPPV
jgi:O-succinylbenzoic acid--CoA ligase